MKIVYLKPNSGFITELRSDTLWGMICWGIRNVYGNNVLEETIDTFNSNKPEFLISSTFPYKKKDNTCIQYFPKPILPIEPFKNEIISLDVKTKLERNVKDKKNKKKAFIDFDQFQKLINHEIELERAINESDTIKLDSTSVTHNTIDRIKGATLKKDGVGQLFHKDEYFFENDSDNEKDEVGLFFLIKGNSEKVEGALRWMKHIGFGGDRNTGKGHFNVKIEDFVIKEPKNFNAVTNLSLYFPSESRVELGKFKFSPLFNYQIEKRQGYMSFLKYNNFNKPETLMFKEGSVFPSIPNYENYGEIKLIKKISEEKGLTHNVYQYGNAFMIKMKI